MDIDEWRPQRVVNYRQLQAMERRQAWMAFVAKLELGWYESWRAVLTEAPPQRPDPLKPWLFNW